MQKAILGPICEGTVSHPSFRLTQLLPRVPKESLGKEPAFLHEGQGKKLTFSAIQSSPYSPASHFSSAVIQECSAQLFSLKYQTLQRRGEKNLCSNDPSEKQSLFLVNKMRLQFPSQLQHSAGSFLCFICSKCGKSKKKAPSQWARAARAGARRHPWGHRAGRKCAGSAQPRRSEPLQLTPRILPTTFPWFPPTSSMTERGGHASYQNPSHVSEPESNAETSPL